MSGQYPYIDFHTHKAIFADDGEVLEIVSCHKECKHPESLHTLAHHPWWTNHPLTPDEVTTLKNYLILNNKCIGLGEFGLDKLKGASKHIQEEVFHQHIQLANELQSPVIIHCVRQYDTMLALRKYGKTPWVIHGYRRNKILAKSLLDYDIKVSVSPFEEMNTSFVELLAYLPDDTFFIETDSDYRLNIKQRYAIMSNLRKLDIFDLRKKMFENTNEFFKWKKLDLIG